MCLFNCARTVAVGENVVKEEIHVTEGLKANVYPEHVIRSAERPRRKRQKEETPKYTICIPYESGLSEDLRKYTGGLISEQYSPQSRHLEGNSPELKMLTLF